MKREYMGLLAFALVLILFAIFSNQMSFHDSYEYITISKTLSGVQNVDMFSSHSMLYTFIVSIFLKIWPSLIIIRLVNTLFIFIIGLIMLLWLKNRKAFIIFALSPLSWFMSIQTTPVLGAALAFFLAFIFFKKSSIKYNKIYSGFFLGLSFAFYTPMILISFFFMLIYFWDRPFLDFFKYGVAFGAGFLPRALIELYLFKMPIYSLIRYVGTNLVVAAGGNPETSMLHILSNLQVLLIIIVISPLLFKLYKLNYKNYKKEIIFLIITSLIFLIRGAEMTFFIIISPIIILLLVKVLSKKELYWHIGLSIIIIIFLTNGFFGNTLDSKVERDIENIINDNPGMDYLIAGPLEVLRFSSFTFEEKPYFVWYQDFDASKNKENTIRSQEITFSSKVPLKNKLRISANFNRYEDKTYENYIIISAKDENLFPELKNYQLIKCYEVVCTYHDERPQE